MSKVGDIGQRRGRIVHRLARLCPSGRDLVVAAPFAWLILFFLIPFLVVAKISVSEMVIGRPPFTEIFVWTEGWLPRIEASLENFRWLATDSLYWVAYLNSVKIALISTLICLLIGYPMAYAIARARPTLRILLLMMVILPFWTSFLLRVYAWTGILRQNGTINNALMGLGIIDEPILLLYTDFSVYVGIVYSYLPFMILPLYANLEKLDGDLLEAAADLGCPPWKTFLTITLPLSLPGILAGSMLVFIPAVGEFVIPALLGGPDTLMIGRVLWDEFFSNRDWPMASAVTIILVLVLVVPIAIFQRQQLRAREARDS